MSKKKVKVVDRQYILKDAVRVHAVFAETQIRKSFPCAMYHATFISDDLGLCVKCLMVFSWQLSVAGANLAVVFSTILLFNAVQPFHLTQSENNFPIISNWL